MPRGEFWKRLIARLMNRVHINRVRRCRDAGEVLVEKQRRHGAGPVIFLGNRFLAWAGSPARLVSGVEDWIAWEVYCHQLLDPQRRVEAIPLRRAVRVAVIPGDSLRQLILQGRLEPQSVLAAAQEIRRVHQLPGGPFHARWSHGDLHLDNVIYDASQRKAALIDFDTRHIFATNETARQGDDLKVFLLELVARLEENWLEMARLFVTEYGDPLVLRELNRQLAAPLGMAQILWYTQTHCSSRDRIEPRLQILRDVLGDLAGRWA